MILSAGHMAGYFLSFLRNLILARLLTKADYGLAALFGMAVTLLEINGRMSFGTQVIQSEEGESSSFLATAHLLQFIGGCCSALLLAVAGFPFAHLFHVPNARWAFVALALVPFVQGAAHLDIARRQRRLDFTPLVATDIIPQLISTALAWPLAIWMPDYRVILWLMLIKAAMTTASTFAFAESPYRWQWHSRHVRSILQFGWPLLLTGMVIFASQQADQLLVGAAFSLNALAIYALAVSLVSIPYTLFGQVVSALALPIMSRAQNDLPRLRAQYRLCAEVAATIGAVCSVPLIIIGEWLVVTLYGGKYAGAGPFMAVLGAAAAARFLRYAPAVAALAKADTINQLFSNLWRAGSLPLAVVVWLSGGTPVHIACCALVGELLAVLVSLIRLARRQHIPMRDSAAPAVYLLLLVALGAATGLLVSRHLSLGLALTLGLTSAIVPLVAAYIAFPGISTLVFERLHLRSKAMAPETTTS